MPESRAKTQRKRPKKNLVKKKKFSWKNFLGGVLAGMSVIGFFVIFWPHTDVEMTGTFNPSKKSFFGNAVITNNGVLPLENVTIGMRCGPFNYIPMNESFEDAEKELGPDVLDTKPFTQSGFGEKEWKTDYLASSKHFEVILGNPLEVESFLVWPNSKTKIKVNPGFIKLFRIHIGIVVGYNLWFFPFRLENQQMFRTVVVSKDHLEWLYE